MIDICFKRRINGCSESEQKFELVYFHLERPVSLAVLQKEMIADPDHKKHIIFVTDPNVEPMRVIIRPDYKFFHEPIKRNTLELYYYKSKGGDEI